MEQFIDTTNTKRDIITLILCSIAIKLVYVIVFIFYNGGFPESFHELLLYFFRNDSGWYENIAANGYKDHLLQYPNDAPKEFTAHSQSSWAFFPLYPMLCGMLMSWCNLTFVQSAFIWSLLLSASALILFYKTAVIFTKSSQSALYATLLFLVFPFHYHLSMYYSEALFLTCLLGTIVSLYRKQYLWAIIATSALVLIRPNGIITLIPLWLLSLEWSNTEQKIRLTDFKNIMYKSLLFIPAGLVFAGYLYYQYLQTGYYNAFSLAQKGWAKEFIFPFLSLFRNGFFETQFNSVYVIIVMAYALLVGRKLSLSMNLFIWLNLLLPLTAGSTISMSRYIMVLFPLFILLGQYLYNKKGSYAVLLLLLAGQLYLLRYWNESNALSY